MGEMVSEKFSVVYHGDSLNEGQIDVRELAPSLLALDDLIEEANRALNGKFTKISLKLNANLQTNSFEVALEIYQWVVNQAQDVIQVADSVTIREVLGYLGFAWGAYKESLSLISVLKKLKGKEVVNVKKDENNNYLLVAVDSNGVETEVKVPLEIYVIFSNRTIRNAINKVLAPLRKPGMESIEWKYKGQITERVEKDDLPAFEPPVADPEVSHDDVIVGPFTIRSVSFDKTMKWRLVHKPTARKFSVTISDERFWQNIEDNRESFHKGDVLEARVEVVTKDTKAGPIKEWYATNIINHYAPKEQTRLTFEE